MDFRKLVLKPTIYCFHKCKYCDLRQDFYTPMINSRQGHMDLDFAKTLLNDAYKSGMQECLISGGDPLMYPHLVELIKAANRYPNVFVYMNSVGTRLTEDRAHSILSAGLGAWNISLDSPISSIHNEWRGVKNAWESSMDALGILIKLQKNEPQFSEFKVNFMTVITRYNYNDLSKLFSLALDKGVASVHLMNVYGDDENNDFLLSIEQILEFKNTIVPEILQTLFQHNVPSVVLENAKTVLSSFFSTHNNTLENYAKGIYWNDFETVKNICNQPNFYSLIEPTGQVLPCCLVEISHIGVVGNALKESLPTIWMGEKYNEFRENRIPFCIKCSAPRQMTIGLIPEMCRQFHH